MADELAAKVAVSVTNFGIDRPYTYLLPPELAQQAQAGQRVMVPFGSGNRPIEGIILKCIPVPQDQPYRLKPVQVLLDSRPVLDEEGVQLALWMHDRLFCTVYEAVKTMLPAGLYFSLKDRCVLLPGVERSQAEEAAGRSPSAQKLVEVLYANNGAISMENLRVAFGTQNPNHAIKLLKEKEIVELETAASRGIGDKTEEFVTLALSCEEALAKMEECRRRWPVWYSVVELLCTLGRAPVKEVCYYTGASKTTLKTLEKNGIVALEREEVSRRPKLEAVDPLPPPVLNDEQQAVFEGLRGLMEQDAPTCSLLYGVTGSGKTQVYIQLIHAALAEGKSAIMLVPEIALTPQVLRLFRAQFGDTVAVLHSMLSTGERYDEWKRIRRGEAKVVVGTRSAVFAPVQDLGLLILDEEQENSYKSENAPRYHAREIAKYRCVRHKAALVLGSATPSVESMFLAKAGKYHLFTLKERFNRQALPQVLLADMKLELRSGNGTCISGILQKELTENLQRGEQSILFLNRRGTNRMAVCMNCGDVPVCEACSVCLTYHRDNGRLVCHYCGRSISMPFSCSQCGGSYSLEGIGTQKVEEELQKLFPDVEILRMDTDTVSISNSHDRILQKFVQEKIPILIGTQMVAKGLDFENVTLVGVISADQMLYVDDYRAAERAFSLLTQVVGRAGRGERTGRAVIQTCTPKNEVIRFASDQNYDDFYDNEILMRQLRDQPPFCDCYRITLSGESLGLTQQASYRLRNGALTWRQVPALQAAGLRVLGPSEATVLKVNNRYRYHVYLFCQSCPQIREAIFTLLKVAQEDKQNRGVSIYADWNPLD